MIFSIAGSTACAVFRIAPGPIAPIASALTMLIGTAAVFRSFETTFARKIAGLIAVLALGAAVEVIGLATGLPFGRYVYTPQWVPVIPIGSLGFFPVLLPVAWALLVSASTGSVAYVFDRWRNRADPNPRVVGQPSPQGSSSEPGAEISLSLPKGEGRGEGCRTPRTFGLAAVSGLFAAAIDLAMEPVMTARLGYWKWTVPGPLPGGAPWMNFFGWWATAALGAHILLRFGPGQDRRRPDPLIVLVGYLVLIAVLAAVPASRH